MRKADAATYQEVRCRSALNRVKGMPFEWTLNPYRGCTHGCHYCFARRYHTQFELDADDSFASVILVKVNFVEVLSKELSRERWDRDTSVALGTATDPYQPIEGQYKLTRGAIVELGASKTPFGIVTKGPMVMRDADVLQQASRSARVTVCVSVPTVDEDAWRKLEPGTAHPRQRLRAVRRSDARAFAPACSWPRWCLASRRAASWSSRRWPPSPSTTPRSSAPTCSTSKAARDHCMTYLAKDFPLVPGMSASSRTAPSAYRRPTQLRCTRQSGNCAKRWDCRKR
jgi:hypothetical protein